jgi:hypothetical protein
MYIGGLQVRAVKYIPGVTRRLVRLELRMKGCIMDGDNKEPNLRGFLKF